MKGSVVITGGGTGGHLKVADTFIEEFHKRGIKSIFVGSVNGQDKSWFENDKRLKKAIFLDTKGVVNKNFSGKIKSLLKIFSAMGRCNDLFSKHNVKIVISVGGFSAAPAAFSSILTFGCKLYIHEQNSVMGKLNEVTSKFATGVFSSFDNKSLVKDYPVSNEFFDNARIRDKLKTIIFLGGSQGAQHINNFALKVAPTLKKIGLNIIHQTGSNDFQRVKDAYSKMNIEVDVFDFTKDLSIKMKESDFAISRAGASTLWELSANALPTLFIPYPYAYKDHQYANAMFLKQQQLCYICREKDLTEELFIKYLKKDNHKISKKLVNSIMCNGVESIVDILIENNK